MSTPKNRLPTSSVTISMLISESVYKLVVCIERIIRWFAVAVVRPCRLQFRCLHWKKQILGIEESEAANESFKA